MEKWYYTPISAYVFPEIACAEAISPTNGDVAGVFVGRGSFPTKVTGSIPVNPIPGAIVLYSMPVTWEYKDGSVMDYPMVVKISGDLIDGDSLSQLTLPSLPPGVNAWVYSRTLFFDAKHSVQYVFRSDVEMLQQMQRLSPFQEVKDLNRLKDDCGSFEDFHENPIILSDMVGGEIRAAIADGVMSSAKYDCDLKIETRTGACLGYELGSVPLFVTNNGGIKKPDEVIALIRDQKTRNNAERLLHDIRVMQQNLAQIVSGCCDFDVEAVALRFKAYYRFRGRACLDVWNRLDPVLQKCVDFIASRCRESWNWFSDESRLAFMRDLWNAVLLPGMADTSQEIVESMRSQAQCICRYFKAPNAISVEMGTLKSPLMQALYLVLDCAGDMKRLARGLPELKRQDFGLALYGAFKGYAYLSRSLLPERIRTTPARVSREDILSIVAGVREQGGAEKDWKRVVAAVDRAMMLELDRQSTKAFLYILNNLIPVNDPVYTRMVLEFENEKSEYDYTTFKSKVRKILADMGEIGANRVNAVMLAVELEDKRRNPIAFKYILDDCIREGGDDAGYRRVAKLLLDRMDLWYGGEPADIDGMRTIGIDEGVVSHDSKIAHAATKVKTKRTTSRKKVSAKKKKSEEAMLPGLT